MAGKVRKLINELLALRTSASPVSTHFVKVNLLLAGIDPDTYTDESEDDPEKVAELKKMIVKFQGALREKRRPL